MKDLYEKADILMEALPYIQRLWGKHVVVKYGGSAMKDEKIIHTIMQDVTLLKYVGVNPIVIHGGGPEINRMLEKLSIKSDFHNGTRITSAETMEVVEMVLAGKVNKNVVSMINSMGAKAIGLSGKDANLIKAKKKISADGVDLGFVGEVVSINTKLLLELTSTGYIPVIAPVGFGDDGNSYNINADTVAGEIAAAVKAEKLMFLTDVDGVRMNPEDKDTLISIIEVDHIYRLIEQKVIKGGMIPKVMGCIKSIEQGVSKTHIVDGTLPHSIILEIFTDKGIGTMVTA
ncbi:MAG: acetylglutamate kinase [Clostridia bacterium]|nr:acetylglutamate kinase [Clostridia bacterium]